MVQGWMKFMVGMDFYSDGDGDGVSIVGCNFLKI